MKKDLAALREADSLKEREKIKTIKSPLPPTPQTTASPVPKPIEQEVPRPIAKKIPVVDAIAPAMPPVAQELSRPVQPTAPANANEIEKQQIFLLQSEKTELEKKLKELGEEKDPALFLEKNRLLLEQKDLEQKLVPFVREAGSATEARKQVIEKQRLPWDMKISKLKERITYLDGINNKSEEKEASVKAAIARVQNSLKTLSIAIEKRGQAKPEPSFKPAPQKPITEPRPIIQRPPVTPLADKPAFAKSSAPAVEKMAKSTEIEETHRRKFIEDVEKWAAASSKNTHDDEIK